MKEVQLYGGPLDGAKVHKPPLVACTLSMFAVVVRSDRYRFAEKREDVGDKQWEPTTEAIGSRFEYVWRRGAWVFNPKAA